MVAVTDAPDKDILDMQREQRTLLIVMSVCLSVGVNKIKLDGVGVHLKWGFSLSQQGLKDNSALYPRFVLLCSFLHPAVLPVQNDRPTIDPLQFAGMHQPTSFCSFCTSCAAKAFFSDKQNIYKLIQGDTCRMCQEYDILIKGSFPYMFQRHGGHFNPFVNVRSESLGIVFYKYSTSSSTAFIYIT